MKNGEQLSKLKESRFLVFSYHNSIPLVTLLIIPLLRSPLDPNAHHDGYMYVMAVASATGLIPNRDFFSQYGPVTNILQGWWLSITTMNLLSLRILTALILGCTGFLMYKHIEKHFGKKLSFLISFLWILSSPRLLPADLPWSTTISTLFFIICFFLTSSLKSGSWFVAGFLSGLNVFVRQHNLLLILILFSLQIFSSSQRPFPGKLLRPMLFGILAGFGSVLTFILYTGSFRSWIEQTIIWPITGHSGTTYPLKAMLVNTFLTLQFPISALLIYLLFIMKIHKKVLSVALILVILVFLSIISAKVNSIPVEERSFRNIKYFVYFFAGQSSQLLAISSIGFVIFLGLRSFRKFKTLSTASAFQLLVATSCLAQLYPSPDSYHIWWIAPIMILTISTFFPFPTLATREKIALLLLPLLVVNCIQVAQDFSKPREVYRSTVLRGMMGNDRNLDQGLLMLEDSTPGSVNFDCSDGIYAANQNGYLSSSWQFVNWGPKDQTKNLNSRYIFRCVYEAERFKGFFLAPVSKSSKQ